MKDSDRCPFCGGPARFALGFDINMCHSCGAHETTKGWMKRNENNNGGPDSEKDKPDDSDNR